MMGQVFFLFFGHKTPVQRYYKIYFKKIKKFIAIKSVIDSFNGADAFLYSKEIVLAVIYIIKETGKHDVVL